MISPCTVPERSTTCRYVMGVKRRRQNNTSIIVVLHRRNVPVTRQPLWLALLRTIVDIAQAQWRARPPGGTVDSGQPPRDIGLQRYICFSVGVAGRDVDGVHADAPRPLCKNLHKSLGNLLGIAVRVVLKGEAVAARGAPGRPRHWRPRFGSREKGGRRWRQTKRTAQQWVFNSPRLGWLCLSTHFMRASAWRPFREYIQLPSVCNSNLPDRYYYTRKEQPTFFRVNEESRTGSTQDRPRKKKSCLARFVCCGVSGSSSPSSPNSSEWEISLQFPARWAYRYHFSGPSHGWKRGKSSASSCQEGACVHPKDGTDR